MEHDSIDFDPYVKEANSMVDSVINNALTIHKKYLNNENKQDGEGDTPPVSEDITESEESSVKVIDIAPNIQWLPGKDFTIDAGEQKINEFLKTWIRDESWLYCINFLGKQEHDCDNRYRYRVMWSVPTRRKPIPRATASVYFTIKVSKFKPKTFPVEVYYVFETSSLVHRPGQSKFQQKWLKDVIDSKINLMEDIRF